MCKEIVSTFVDGAKQGTGSGFHKRRGMLASPLVCRLIVNGSVFGNGPSCAQTSPIMPLRLALRALRRSPGFSVLAILILTLGIGATTAMFSVTRTVLLKPLAYRNPSRLVTALFKVPQLAKQLSTIPVNAQHYQLWRDHARTLEEVGLVAPDAHILSGRGQSVQVNGVRVTPNFFHLLGIEPALGRDFSKDEDQTGRNRVVILSHRFWLEKLGGRRDALGQKITFDGQPYQVIGVMPAAFPFPRGRQLSDLVQMPEHAAFWTPLAFSPDDLGSPLGDFDFIAVSRLKSGVTVAQALADLTALEKVIAKRYPEPVEIDPVIRPLQVAMARDVRLPLLILLAAVSAVLLIVCINLMNLMLVRATAQRREWAIRLAVGANMRDLLSGAFLESLLLSFAGAALGSLLTVWLLAAIRLKAPVGLPRVEELALDPVALAFALLLSVGSAVLFGLWPVWRAARVDPQEALQSSSRSTSEGRRGHRAGKLLVAAEVALSTVLLLSAGLLVRSFISILDVNPGLNIQHLLTVKVDLPPETYRKDENIHAFYRRVQDRVRALPGVESAGVISGLPLNGDNNSNPVSAGDRAAPPLPEWSMTDQRWASPSYFRAAGIPLLQGRIFAENDSKGQEAVITETLAARLWPSENPVGRPLRGYGGNRLYTVVGVVGAVHAASLTAPAPMMVYFLDWQNTDTNMSLAVRTASDPASLAPAIRRTISALEPQAAITDIKTMQEIRASSLAPQRFQMILLSAFAGAALLLACLGIYGVLAFTTARRTSEIGIRMALGARPKQILRSILASGMAPVFLGILAGLLASVALARLFQALLFEVSAFDPLLYAGTALVLIGVAALACLVPALKAARLNPVEALRSQ